MKSKKCHALLSTKQLVFLLGIFLMSHILYAQDLNGTFISNLDRHYQGKKYTNEISTKSNQTAWKGERVSFQLLIWSSENIAGIEYEVSDFLNNESNFSNSNISLSFPSFIKGDSEAKSCGAYPSRSGNYLISDALAHDHVTEFNSNDTIPIWVSIDIPESIVPGSYLGSLTIADQNQSIKFDMDIDVIDRAIPAVEDWGFHLDLWQFPTLGLLHYNDANPSSKIELWSDQHFELFLPAYQLLANSGQKVITTHIKQNALGVPSMITWKLNSDGSWSYDFTAFDKYVNALMSLGINKQINCFSPVGWNESTIPYWDESTQMIKSLTAPLNSDEYRRRWDDFLSAFKAHLEEKSWFDKTVLFLDEVAESKLRNVIETVKANSTDWKLGIAYSHALSDASKADFYDLSGILESASNSGISEDKISTFYTSCTQTIPNSYVTIQNSPAEMVWMAYHSQKEKYDGFLRWAYDNWRNTDPTDIRDGSNTAGDFAMIYRSSNDLSMNYYSSIRLEMLRDGIEDFEKINILKEEFLKSDDPFDKDALMELEKLISIFDKTSGKDARETIPMAKNKLAALAIGEVPYCRAGGKEASSYYLSSISIASNGERYEYSTTEYPLNGYDRTNENIPLRPNTPISIDLSIVGELCYQTNIWIDWNLDETFDEESELVYSGSNMEDCSSANLQVNIVTPENLSIGNGRVRVQITDTTNTAKSCGFNDNASYVDLPFSIIDKYCSAKTEIVSGFKLGKIYIDACGSIIDLENIITSEGYFIYDQPVQIGSGQSFEILLEARKEAKCAQTLIWIDFNGDGDFDDNGELVITQGMGCLNPINQSFIATIPNESYVGKTRMRIQLKEANESSSSPCIVNSNTSTYDIDLVLTETSNTCSPTILSPFRNTTLEGNKQVFTWSANGSIVDEWILKVTSQLPNSKEIEHANLRFGGQQTTTEVSDLPKNGRIINVDLSAVENGNETKVQYQYISSDEYCMPFGGDFEDYFIKSVETREAISNINYSRSDFPFLGYEHHRDNTLIISKDSEFGLDIELSTASNCARAVAWIDWNGNALFESEEIIYDEGVESSCSNGTSISTNIKIPLSANIGLSRMRIRLRDARLDVESCGTASFSGAVDFDLMINESVILNLDLKKNKNVSIVPNPISNTLEIQGLLNSSGVVSIFTLEGKIIENIEFNSHNGSPLRIDVQHLNRGTYIVRVDSRSQHATKRIVLN